MAGEGLGTEVKSHNHIHPTPTVQMVPKAADVKGNHAVLERKCPSNTNIPKEGANMRIEVKGETQSITRQTPSLGAWREMQRSSQGSDSTVGRVSAWHIAHLG